MNPMTDAEKLDHLLRLSHEQGAIINTLVERIEDMQDRQSELEDRLAKNES